MPSRKVYRKDRKASRKTSRKTSRKNRKNRKQYGGNPMEQSLAQGEQFAKIHSAQHGGAYLTGAPLSEIDGSMLPSDLRSFARVEGLDASINDAAAQGPDQATAQMPAQMPSQMPSQTGGRRNRKSRKNRKASRKASRKNRKASRKASRMNRKASRKSCRKNRKSGRKSSRKNRKSRRQAGGSLAGAPVTWESRFLSDSDAAKAGTADFSNPLLKN